MITTGIPHSTGWVCVVGVAECAVAAREEDRGRAPPDVAQRDVGDAIAVEVTGIALCAARVPGAARWVAGVAIGERAIAIREEDRGRAPGLVAQRDIGLAVAVEVADDRLRAGRVPRAAGRVADVGVAERAVAVGEERRRRAPAVVAQRDVGLALAVEVADQGLRAVLVPHAAGGVARVAVRERPVAVGQEHRRGALAVVAQRDVGLAVAVEVADQDLRAGGVPYPARRVGHVGVAERAVAVGEEDRRRAPAGVAQREVGLAVAVEVADDDLGAGGAPRPARWIAGVG